MIEGKVGKYTMRISESQGGIHSALIGIMNNGGEREPELLYILREEISKGMKCIDLGANIGYITLLMCENVGSNGKVYAIEPDIDNLKFLKQNIQLNGYDDITYMSSMAISNEAGETEFYVGRVSNLGGLKETKNTLNSINVRVDTLSNYCYSKGFEPNLIKMDIEGHEVEVLAGFYFHVSRKDFPCKIVMELHPIMYSETHSLEYWLRKYLDIGFKVKYVVSAGVIQPDIFKEWGYSPIKEFTSNRGLYDNFSVEHMIKACCYPNVQKVSENKNSPKIARFLMIER